MALGKNWIVAPAFALAVLAAPLLAANAQARPYDGPASWEGYAGPAPYWTYEFGDGPQWYGSGWRLRSNARGWDHSCITPWLPSQFACSSR